jgi:uncharacterized membrane protein YhaH (DUF805 family)
MEWYTLVWKRYAEFEGRSRRKEYWMFSLINMLIVLAAELAGFVLLFIGIGVIVFPLLILYSLALLIPSLAVSVRRLHDTGKSGWWLLIGLIPLIGGIVLIVFLASDSEPGVNLYGPSPKYMQPFPIVG